MQDMIVISKADELPVWAIDMDMAAAQRARRIRCGDIHRLKVVRRALIRHHAAAMVKIILPVFIRVFRTMYKDVFIHRRMDGHHTNMRPVFRTIEDLYGPGLHINPFNRLSGKGGSRRTNVKGQPLAVRSPVRVLVS